MTYRGFYSIILFTALMAGTSGSVVAQQSSGTVAHGGDAIGEVQIIEQTFYRWRKQYGGMVTAQLKELKHLQRENERLRRAVSDLTLDKLILKEAARGNF